jgi:uncharacterized protein involved in exopolysaccharide biosynthesis
MKLLVKRERVDPLVTTEPTTGISGVAPAVTEEELNSELELIKSRDLLERVVVTCGLDVAPKPFFLAAVVGVRSGPPSRAPLGNPRTSLAVRALETALSAEVVKNTNLIAVSYKSSDPELAARVLNTVANLYLEKHVAVNRPPGAVDFFRQQAQEYEKELATAEARLVSFTDSAGVVSADAEKGITLQKLTEFDATFRQTQAAIAETEQRIRTLEALASSTPARIVTQVRSSDDAALLGQLNSSLLTLELKRTELLQKFNPGYRPVQEVEAQIAQVRAALAAAEKSPRREETTDRDFTHDWVSTELAKAKADLAGLRARAEATALTVRAYQERARSLEQKEVVQDDLIRTVKATEQDYMLYLHKQEEARISDALDRSRIVNVSIAEAATVPSIPSNPRSKIVLMGGVLAVFVSIGLALAAEYLDPTFRTPDEVREILDIPVFASIPKNGH